MKLKGGKKSVLSFLTKTLEEDYTRIHIYIYNLLSTNISSMSSSLIEIYQLTYLPKLFQT